jgi:hypothetical protein
LSGCFPACSIRQSEAASDTPLVAAQPITELLALIASAAACRYGRIYEVMFVGDGWYLGVSNAVSQIGYLL